MIMSQSPYGRHSKLLASSGFPCSLYWACSGYAQSGRLRPGNAAPVAVRLSGATPCSTHRTIASSAANLSSDGAAAAVSRARHEEEAAPLAHAIGAAVRLRHPVVVVDSVERREPRGADAIAACELPCHLPCQPPSTKTDCPVR